MDGALFDKDFVKPQAFHTYPVTRSGGLANIKFKYFLWHLLFALFQDIL